jgi:heterodisulfide reductase subunit A2
MERRIGVYICHCGLNIAATVNPREVAEHAATQRGVVVARNYMFMCSDPGQEMIRNDIKEHRLNRVIVASCSPLMHERTFRRVCREAGLNPYLFEMANIREHCSWVHKEGATEKARELVAAAVRRVYYHEPLLTKEVSVNPATLVVGGGIAGIQAALDIASAGYKVYLVEREPSIGGHMIQLDKTFPTLDCSACITTPRMSDSGSHPNIQLFTYSEVEEISGFIGNFKAKIRKKARYVDISKCTGCALCFAGCPVVMKNEFDLGLAERRAVYKPFPQAVPNKAVIDKREDRLCKAACADACPVHTNVLGYVKLIAEGKFKEAYLLNRSVNPLPSVCGDICYAPCEGVCNRGQMEEAVAIRHLKKFAASQVNIDELEVPQITKTGRKVAVVGAGPAGLAAANDLGLKGHDVMVFEALPEPGGMLRYGIPEYRLPKETLKKEIDYIRKLGVEIKTGVDVGKEISLAELRKSYDAVFLGVGARNGMSLGLQGQGDEEPQGVIDGIKFLQKINLGEKLAVGKKVAVIGGGNTAIDCARTVKRLGSEEVTIVYRRSRAEMPAAAEEVEAAEKEGVRIEFLTNPTRFVAEKGTLSGMECIRMELGEPDESGRRRPAPVKGSEFTTSFDMVIPALGQTPETGFSGEIGVTLNKNGLVLIDPVTGATNIEGVFSGGDVVTGPAYVIDAIAAGKKAARSIDCFLKGQPLPAESDERKPAKLSDEEVSVLKGRFGDEKRVAMNEAPVEERVKDFREVAFPYTPEEAKREAMRCLAGQVEGCIQCGECEKRCEPKAIRYDARDETVEVEIGNIIIATGYQQFDPSVIKHYGYGRYENVITGLEFERLSNASGPTGGQILLKNGEPPKSVAVVHCVGSRDKNYHSYCSRVCCMFALKMAHLVRDKTKADVYQMYIDMRCFGEGYEEFYERVGTEDGVRFIRGKVARVTDRAVTDEEQDKLIVQVEDTLVGGLIRVPVDMVILCAALEPQADTEKVSRLFSVGRRADGFFLERHVKLDPVKTMNDGIFIAGCCAGPKDIPDTVAQAKASAAEVLNLLARGKVEVEPIVASVDEEVCAGCGLCEKICAYGAPSVDPHEGVSKVNQALCKGCGACAGVCPSGAMSLCHFTYRQVLEQVDALAD